EGSAMSNVSLRSAMVALVLAIGATAAHAADYSPPPPPCVDAGLIASGRAPAGSVPCYVPPPPVVEEFSSWYLRGDIGMSNQSVKNLDNALYSGNSIQAVGMGFDSGMIAGVGVGYYFNDWLRFDLTGEYRGRTNFHGLDIVTPGGGGAPYTDEYHGSKSEWLALANAYVDLGTWNNFTPFVGAGVGFSRNTIHSFTDTCVVCAGGSVATGADASKWDFAWALHAGVSYKVSKNFAIELAYRYVNLGGARSGDLVTYNGINNVNNPMEFKSLTSHDIRLGLRMNFDAFTSRGYSPVVYSPQPSPVSVYAQAPPSYMQAPATTYQQPAPVYAPQPTYAQPTYAQPTYAQPGYGGYAPRR
ncbi:MAG TPA: outer membrane beta-barrel protein, partial [Pseudolabrys sp.]